MNYGPHADAPFLQLPNGPLRSDVSATLFIGARDSYEGGELVIHLGNERHSFKGEPGSMIIYPSTTLHEVAPVTSGERLSMFTFRSEERRVGKGGRSARTSSPGKKKCTN